MTNTASPTSKTFDAILERARELGTEHGTSAGSYVFDGNTDRETYEKVLKGYDDGDPEIMDMAPAPLSGEWADGMTISRLRVELDVDEKTWEGDNDLQSSAVDDYELAFSDGYWGEVCRVARHHLED